MLRLFVSASIFVIVLMDGFLAFAVLCLPSAAFRR
jgi:hypothetical protein